MVRAWLGLAAAVTAACTEAPTSPTSPVGGAAPSARTTASSTASGSNATPSNASTPASPSPAGYSMRFHGNPSADVDLVKVPIDPQVAADLGGDLTIEFWLKTEPSANPATSCQAGSDGWTYGNVILDRDVFGTGDYGEYRRLAQRRTHRLRRRPRRAPADHLRPHRRRRRAVASRRDDAALRRRRDAHLRRRHRGGAGRRPGRRHQLPRRAADRRLVRSLPGRRRRQVGRGHRQPRVLRRPGRAASVVQRPLLDAVRSSDHAVHRRRRHGAAVPLRRRASWTVCVERRRHVGPGHARPVPPRWLGHAGPAL